MQACFRDTLQSTVRAAAHWDTFKYSRGAGILNFDSDTETCLVDSNIDTRKNDTFNSDSNTDPSKELSFYLLTAGL